jgi:hypothetical protein
MSQVLGLYRAWVTLHPLRPGCVGRRASLGPIRIEEPPRAAIAFTGDVPLLGAIGVEAGLSAACCAAMEWTCSPMANLPSCPSCIITKFFLGDLGGSARDSGCGGELLPSLTQKPSHGRVGEKATPCGATHSPLIEPDKRISRHPALLKRIATGLHRQLTVASLINAPAQNAGSARSS